MTPGEVTDSIKKYLEERINTPFIASVIAVWLFLNKVIVFGIFNFDTKMTLADRVTWVSGQFDNFDWVIEGVRISGFYAQLFKSLFWGLIVMLCMPYINVVSTYLYEKVISHTRGMLANISRQKWKTRSEYETMESKKIYFENEANKLSVNVDSMIEQDKKNGIKIIELGNEIEILKENNKNLLTRVDKKLSTDLSLVFKGNMMNEYNYDHEPEDIDPHPEPFKMDGNKYITTVNNKHEFDIDNVKINLEEKQVIFRKVRVEDSSKAWNYLIIWPDGSLRGFEDKGNRVKYYHSS